MDEHHRKDDEKIEIMYHTLFGNKEMGVKGMVEKVDDIHTLLTQARTVRDFFGGFKAPVMWLLVIGGAIVVFKGWAAGLIAWITLK